MNVIRSLMELSRPIVRAKRALFGPTRPTWNEDFEIIANVMRRGAPFTTRLPISLQRTIMDPPARRALRYGGEFTRLNYHGIPAEICEPKEISNEGIIFYLHGGGYAAGSVGSHRDLIDRLAHHAKRKVLAIEYRLAPEHPFPAGLEDSLRAYRGLLRDGYDPREIAIGGDSAGGGLTLATLFCLRDAGHPLPAAAFLISPWVDVDTSRPSIFENAKWDYVTRSGLRTFARFYAPREMHKNPFVSPVYGDFSGLPPMLVHAGGIEGLRDDAIAVKERADAAGVPCELEIFEDMFHAFHVMAAICPQAEPAIQSIARFIRERAVLSVDEAARAS